MSYEYTGRRRGAAETVSPYVPGGPAGLSTPDGPAPAPVPVPAPDPDDKLVPVERGIDLIKNVLVIITCLVVLYALWSVYNALAEVSARLQQLPL